MGVAIVLATACGRSSGPPPKEILIPAGEFIMGCRTDVGCDGMNYPRRPYVPAFYIDRTLVLAGEYRRCHDAGACAENAPPSDEDHYVVQVTQDGAAAYCRWVRKRLPTPEEWEKAARGTDGRYFPWGNHQDHPCIEGSCLGVRSPYGVERVVHVRQWVDHRSEPDFPRGMGVGENKTPYSRSPTSEWTKRPYSGRPYFEVAAFRCARSVDP